MATPVDVVELALGHRVVDVDGREQQCASLHHLVEPMDPGGGLLADPADGRTESLPVACVAALNVPQQIENDPPLFRFGLRIEPRHLADLLELVALVNEQRGVTAIVHDQRRAAAVRPHQRLTGAPPVIGERLALPGEHRDPPRVLRRATPLRTSYRNRRGRMILRREDVAGHPADVGSERVQRLDEHGGLHRHVQTAHDPDTRERRLPLIFPAQRHQPRHLLLGEPDLVASERRQRQIRYLERFAACLGGLVERMTLLHSRRSH